MSDKNVRLLEAERVLLHILDIQIEQYRIHLEELAGDPHEAAKARAVLEKMTTAHAWQKKYCDLLANTQPADVLSARSRSRVA
jgi:hypothetical protein